ALMSTVSEIIFDAPVKAGARRCYAIVGDTINHFGDAVRRSPLRWFDGSSDALAYALRGCGNLRLLRHCGHTPAPAGDYPLVLRTSLAGSEGNNNRVKPCSSTE
ncbi:MAG: hypothetical protein WCA32_17270, partial [Chromatiaceae bacterium]